MCTLWGKKILSPFFKMRFMEGPFLRSVFFMKSSSKSWVVELKPIVRMWELGLYVWGKCHSYESKSFFKGLGLV